MKSKSLWIGLGVLGLALVPFFIGSQPVILGGGGGGGGISSLAIRTNNLALGNVTTLNFGAGITGNLSGAIADIGVTPSAIVADPLPVNRQILTNYLELKTNAVVNIGYANCNATSVRTNEGTTQTLTLGASTNLTGGVVGLSEGTEISLRVIQNSVGAHTLTIAGIGQIFSIPTNALSVSYLKFDITGGTTNVAASGPPTYYTAYPVKGDVHIFDGTNFIPVNLGTGKILMGTNANHASGVAAVNIPSASTDTFTLQSALMTTQLNPADATTYYIGQLDQAGVGVTTFTNVSLIVPQTCTLKRMDLRVRLTGTLGTTEDVNFGTRLNESSTVLTGTMDWDGANKFASATGTQAITAGDKIAVEIVTPTWTTDPVGVRIYATWTFSIP